MPRIFDGPPVITDHEQKAPKVGSKINDARKPPSGKRPNQS